MSTLRRIYSFVSHLKEEPLEINNDVIDKSYRYWQWRIFYSMYIGYIFFYFTRNSFTYIKPQLIAEFHLSKSELGFIGATLSVAYALSKFLSGILSDRSNPQYFMSIGLILTGVCNILFSFSSSLPLLALCWGLNGWFQGWGWPPCAKQLTRWYHHTRRGAWWSIWSTSHNVGGALIPIVAVYLCSVYGWRTGMQLIGFLCIAVGFWLMERLRDSPESLGLPLIEQWGKENPDITIESVAPLSTKNLLFEYVLNNKYVWILSISYFFVYVVRLSFNEWGMLYLQETKGYSQSLASCGITFFEVGGFIGTIAAGWGSDFVFKGRRVPVIVLCSAALVIAITCFWYAPGEWVFTNFFAMGSIGFLIFGPQMLTGIAAAEFAHQKAAGTSTGFAGCFANLGSATASICGGIILDLYGWSTFFLILSLCCLITFSALLPLWSVTGQTPKKSFNFFSPKPKLEEALD